MSMNYTDVLQTLESVISGFQNEAAQIRVMAAEQALKFVVAKDGEARVQALCLENRAIGLDGVVLHLGSYLAGLKSQRPDPKKEARNQEDAERWQYLIRFVGGERMPAGHYKADEEFRFVIVNGVTTVDILKGSVTEHFTNWIDGKRKADT